MMRRGLATVAWLMIGLWAVAVCVFLALDFGWQRDWLTRELERRFAAELGTSVSLGALEGPLHRSFGLRDLRIGPRDAPLLAVERAALRWSAWRLLSQRRLVFRELRVEGLVLDVEYRDGAWVGTDWADTTADEESAPDAGSWLQGIELRNVSLQDASSRFRWDLPFEGGDLRMAMHGELERARLPWEGQRGRLRNAQLELAVLPSRLGQSAVDTGRLQLEASADENATLEGGLEGPLGMLRVDLAAKLAGTDSSLQELNLGFEALDLAAWSGGELWPSRLSGELRARPGEAEALSWVVELGESSLGAAKLLPARFSATTERARWALAPSRLVGDAFSFEFEGQGEGPRLDSAEIALQLADLARIDDSGASGGALELRASLTGELPRPTGSALVEGRALRLGALRLGDLDLALQSHEAGRLELRRLSVQGGDVVVEADPGAILTVGPADVAVESLVLLVDGQPLSLSGRVSADSAHDLRVRAEDVDVGKLARLLAAPASLGGVLDLDLRLDGPWPVPAGEGTLLWRGARLGVLESERVTGELQRDEDGVRLALRAEPSGGEGLSIRLALPVPDEPSQTEAWLSQSGLDLELRGDDVDLRLIEALLPEEQLSEVRGLGAFDLRGKGSLGRPQLTGNLSVRNGSLRVAALELPLAPIEAELSLAGDRVEVKRFDVGAPGRNATAAGQLRLSELRNPGSAVADLELAFDSFPLILRGEGGDDGDASSQQLPGSAHEPARPGRLDGSVQLRGPLEAPIFLGELVWHEPRWRGFRVDRIELEIDRQGEAILAEAQVDYQAQRVLDLEARLPAEVRPDRWLADSRSRVALRGDPLELALLEPFVPRRLVRDLEGHARLEIMLRGAEPEPEVHGKLEIEEGSLRVLPLGQSFSPVVGSAHFDGKGLVIDRIQVGPEGAHARLAGEIELDALEPVAARLDLEFADFPLARSRLLETDVDGSLRLRGPAAALRLRGALALRETQLHLRDLDDPAVKEIRFLGTGARGLGDLAERRSGAEDWVARTDVRVDFEVPRDSWIRGSGADLEVEGRARFARKPGDVGRWTGRGSVVRGTYEVLGRRFRMRRGTLSLPGGAELDPVVDAEADYRVADVTILALLTGRLSDPILRLESEPELPEDDVLAYLLLGRPASEIGQGQETELDRAGLALAAGVAAAELREVLGDSLPIDTLEIEVGDGGSPSQIGVGAYVSDDVFVRYGRRLGREAANEVGLQLRLSEQWSIESSVSDRGDGGADLIWNLDY